MSVNPDKACILIVEDEALIAAELESRLISFGYDVCGKASTAERALALAEQHRPDLIIMDIVLKGAMDGVDAAERIRDQWDIPVVFLTAYADSEKIKRAKLTHPFGYLLKPFHDRDLRVTVEMALYVANVDKERRKAEQALHESEARFKLLYEQAPLPYQSLDENGNFVEVNHSWLNALGYTRDEVIGRNFGDFLHPDWTRHFKANFPRFKAVGEVLGVEFEMLKKDGSTVLVAFNGKIGRDTQGRFKQTHCIFQDITDQRKAEKERDQLQAQLANALELAQLGHWEYDVATDQFTFTDQFYKIFRTTAEEVGGYQMSSAEYAARFVHPEDMPLVREEIEQVLETTDPNYSRTLEHRMRYADGAAGHISVRFFVDMNAQGNVVGTFGVNQDVTERKKTEEAIRESEQKYRLLADNARDVIWIRDMDLNLTYVSPSVERVRGYTPEEAMKQRIEEVLTPDSMNLAIETFDRMLKAFKHDGDIFDEYTMDLEHRCKNGKTIWIEVRTSFLKDSEGKPIGILGVSRDITDRKKALEALTYERDLNERVMETSPAGIVRVNADGQVVYANKRAEDILGIQLSEGVKRAYDDPAWKATGFKGEHFPKEKLPFHIVKHTGQPAFGIQHAIEWPNGRRVLLTVNAAPLFYPAGLFEGMVATIEDITDHWKTKEEYQTLFREMLDGFALHEIICDSEGRPVDYRFLAVNPAFERMTGLKSENIVGKTVLEVLPGTEPYWIETYGEVALTGEPKFFENYSQEVDKYFQVTAFQPTLNQFACIFADITDRKKAESALRESEERYRTILEKSPILFIIHRAGIIEYINAAGCSILGGKSPDDFLGRLVMDFVHPDFQGLILNRVNRLKKGESNPPMDVEVVRLDGEKRFVQSTSLPFTYRGRPAALLMSVDITDRKRAEEEQREREKLFRDVFDQAAVGMSIHTPEGVWLQVNQRLCDILGYSREELLHVSFRDITHPDSVEEDVERIRQMVDGVRNADSWKKRYLRKDGRVIWVRTTTALTRNQDGRPQYFITVTEDINELKEAEKEKNLLQTQLFQAQKMEAIGILAGGIAHDFNNLLQAINGYTQLLIIDKAEDDPDYSNLKAIHDAGLRASDLVRQLLLFSRKAGSENKVLDLNKLIEQGRKILERTIPKMVNIVLHPGDRLWKIMADPVQIEQIILNLGTNASDAMPDGGKLVIETANVTLDQDYAQSHLGAQPGRYVQITVSDTGYGMDRETVEKIFEPFFTTKEIGKGTGLGLASVYGIVKSHGGYITCYSEVGHGTTFKIFFPVFDQSDTVGPKDMVSAPPPGGNETILLVDDEELIRGFASQALRKFGYTVRTATNGEEALEIYSAESNEIALVIMDIGMPGMGGHRCLVELLRINPSAKVLIASGYSLNGHARKTLDAGAAGYVAKPYQLNDLLKKVRTVLKAGE